jgi:hypothetical protein
VEPLSATAARQYLVYRFPDPAGSDRGEPRWRPVLDRLAADRGNDPLVATLQSPLRLFLAVTGYRAPASEPAELTGYPDTAGLDDHLFDLLVPAATTRYPRPGGGRYPPEQVIRWLTILARHLRKEDLAGRSGTDLLLHELWTAAGQRLPRYFSAVIITVASAVAALPYLVEIAVVLPRYWPAVLWLLLCVGLVAMTAWRSSRPTVDLRRFDPGAVRTVRTRRQLAVGIVIAAVIAAVLGAANRAFSTTFSTTLNTEHEIGWAMLITFELVQVLFFGLFFGLSFRLVRALGARPQAIDVPSRLVAQGITHTAGMLVVGLVLVLASGLLWLTVVPAAVLAVVIGLVVGVAPRLVLPFALGLVLVVGLAPDDLVPDRELGLVVGLFIVATSPWLRYLVACLLLARRHELPHRPAVFLDWAYEAGLMRLAGIAVQFRHREFQDWLTRRYAPGTVTSAPSDQEPHSM